jgi:hypothetical protein
MKLSISDDPARGPEIEIEEQCADTFVVVNGVAIARRGSPDTSEAGIWMSLEPGWTVTSSEDLSRVEIMYDSNRCSTEPGNPAPQVAGTRIAAMLCVPMTCEGEERRRFGEGS